MTKPITREELRHALAGGVRGRDERKTRKTMSKIVTGMRRYLVDYQKHVCLSERSNADPEGVRGRDPVR